MTKGQRAGAVARKQAKANTGPTPSRAATFAKTKRKKAAEGGYIGSFIKLDIDGKTVGNPSIKNITKACLTNEKKR